MLILVALLCAFFGSTFIFGAVGLAYTQLLFFIAVRMIIAGFLLLGYTLVRAQKRRITIREVAPFLMMGATFILFPYIAESFALQYLPAAKVSLLWSLEAFVTALLSWKYFGERMTNRKWLGMIIGFLGLIPVLVHQGGRELLLYSLAGFSTADMMLICCVVLTAYSWITFRRLLRAGYSAVQINGIAMFTGGILALLGSLVFESWHPVPISPLSAWPVVAGCIGALIIVGNLVSYNLYGFLLKRYTATFLSVSCGSIPFFTALFEWLFLGRIVSYAFVISFAAVCVGLFIFHREELRQGYGKIL